MAKMNPGELEALNLHLDDMVGRGVQQRQQLYPLWQDAINYLCDNQLANKKRRKGWERIALNHIYPAIMEERGLLSKKTPEIICVPGSKDETDMDAVEVCQGAFQWQWDKDLRMTIKRIMALMDSKIFGYAIVKTWWEDKDSWNEDKQDWDGRTRAEVINPAYFGADPDAETQDDWEFCFTQRCVRLGWAKQRWPEKAKELEAEALITKDRKLGDGST